MTLISMNNKLSSDYRPTAPNALIVGSETWYHCIKLYNRVGRKMESLNFHSFFHCYGRESIRDIKNHMWCYEILLGKCSYCSTADSENIVRCVSPLPESVARRLCAKTYESIIKPCRPRLFCFFMEQHVERLIQQYKERQLRAQQVHCSFYIASTEIFAIRRHHGCKARVLFNFWSGASSGKCFASDTKPTSSLFTRLLLLNLKPSAAVAIFGWFLAELSIVAPVFSVLFWNIMPAGDESAPFKFEGGGVFFMDSWGNGKKCSGCGRVRYNFLFLFHFETRPSIRFF